MKYLEDPDFSLYQGDALEVLSSLPEGSVHCVVTSPPYWGLRDYGTGSWVGGDKSCDHDPRRREFDPDSKQATSSGSPRDSLAGRENCRKCGASRTDNQLGLEATPDLYLERMVAVFREVRRVLRLDGVCWVNMGDSYAGTNANGRAGSKVAGREKERWGEDYDPSLSKHGGVDRNYDATAGRFGLPPGLKPKDLVGMPWRLAFALQQDGWYLRSDVVWSKPNPMPESVTDRPTKAHEYVFLLTKSPRYFFDQEAVREPHTTADRPGDRRSYKPGSASSMNDGEHQEMRGAFAGLPLNAAGRNVRSVWEIPTQPYPEAHFATFPEELVRRCVLAGTSERGCCPECGAPWVRLLERIDTGARQKMGDGWDTGEGGHGTVHRNGREKGITTDEIRSGRNVRSVWEIPTQPYPEAHFATFPEELVRRCILAGTSERGCCPNCGAPWVREVEHTAFDREDAGNTKGMLPGSMRRDGARNLGGTQRAKFLRDNPPVDHGWRPSCGCVTADLDVWPQLKPVPCTVLDPFMGSGTTALVARKHGRRSIGIELSPDYCQLAARRLSQLSLLTEAT